MIVTIDGPTASGKSTVARHVASARGLYYLYTGLLYRALGYILVTEYEYSMAMLAAPDRELCAFIIDPVRFVYRYTPEEQEHIYFQGKDLTPYLKSPEVDRSASLVSASQSVRDLLMTYQRTLADGHDLLVDGRDCGSRVFPEAAYKFFLTAPLAVRAARWQADQERRGITLSLERSVEEVGTRDERDSTRLVSPLVIPAGAIVIDTTTLSIEQVVAAILLHLR